ncbi:Hpt domain-containing protein [uncultured Friedmanniella sp.]|uniref:Hpt domain-containing protein n=1 Tax=uncultured Friedmanniella sp. TaxID=335381 RepID=UPI0035CA5464
MSVPSPEDREDAVIALLRGLSESAIQSNLARSVVIADALQAAEAGQLSESQRLAAVAAAHQVVGSAGTFGLPRASRAAARLEEFLTPAVPKITPGPALMEARGQLDELTALLVAGSADHQFEE